LTKTRLALAKPGVYNGIYDCLFKIVKNDGFLGLYRGLRPLQIAIIPYCAVDMTIFGGIRDWYISTYNMKPSILVSMSAGALSACLGNLCAYPLGRTATVIGA
jgi:hypothetical protein